MRKVSKLIPLLVFITCMFWTSKLYYFSEAKHGSELIMIMMRWSILEMVVRVEINDVSSWVWWVLNVMDSYYDAFLDEQIDYD